MAAAALAASVGCAHQPGDWKLVSSDHFHVYTDQPARDYERVVERLEDVHAGLAASFFGNTATPPLQVFLFGELEFRQLVENTVGGMFIGEHGKKGALVIYDGWEQRSLDEVAAHELAHGFINATFPAVPIWFNEGFATYMSSIVIADDRVWFGSIGEQSSLVANQGLLVPMAELFNARWGQFHGDWERSHYATGWALVHFLLHGEKKRLRPRFDQFGAALSQVGASPGGGAVAWPRVYPEIPLAELDAHVRDHVNAVFAKKIDSRMGFAFTRVAQGPLRVEPAPPPVVEAMRATLRRRRRPDKF